MPEITLPDRIRLCFSVLRYYPITLRDRLRQEGLWEDMEQELHVAAWETERKGLHEHDTCLFASRRIYAFLKAYGYHLTRRDGHKSYCKDKPLSSIAQDPELQETVLARGRPISELEVPTKARFVRDHPEEAILALLRAIPGGISKRDLYTRLVLTARELDRHCAPLIKQGLVVEVKRENTFGRPLTPLLVAVQPGQTPPTPKLVKTEQMERIRQAYFLERKSIKQIAREFHHSKTTVRKGIRTEAEYGPVG